LDSALAAGTTPEQRADIYNQSEAVLDKDTATIFVYQYVSPRLVKPYVQGFADADPLNNYHVKDIKILKH
ncbi:MAG: oligopeptide ABC transporter substrate-binding protein OppA, partial [Moraxella sp.]|nr:oligopeptide ABC transporter substrate-binding protein OppA [Moraxella sp.]